MGLYLLLMILGMNFIHANLLTNDCSFTYVQCICHFHHDLGDLICKHKDRNQWGSLQYHRSLYFGLELKVGLIDLCSFPLQKGLLQRMSKQNIFKLVWHPLIEPVEGGNKTFRHQTQLHGAEVYSSIYPASTPRCLLVPSVIFWLICFRYQFGLDIRL